ncbi:MAG: GntR family transcriptional regulator [Bacilli bacterium]|nr:GntR family transcriptional regulator [Bacilli bacterium]
MDIVINHDSDTPIYRQIVEQIGQQIIQNKIKANDILPSIRAIALNLKISVITTKKAYEELETMGLIYTISGKGCFVSEIKHQYEIDKRMDLAKERIKKDLEYYHSIGLSVQEVLNLISEYY